ncbi:MAG: sigma-70 family RNA polymerase sigma factor [Saprospiraceae bacterium]|nr:sigma-70 family RNA polymerase sigma factor [Saprospiraceae bacterium]
MSTKEYKERIWPLRTQLYHVAYRVLGRQDLAEDAVQDVLIKAWEKREEWSHIESWKAWLLTLTRNRSIDMAKLKSHQTRDLDKAPEKVDKAPDPYQLAERSDLMVRLEKILKTLPLGQQAVFQLREFGQLTYEEIGQELGMTLSQVKVNLYRARQGLREKLQMISV